MYQDKNSDWHMEQGDSLEIKNVKMEGQNMEGKYDRIFQDENFYKNNGVAIYIKGQFVYGIHPDNLVSNLQSLNDGTMKFDWVGMLGDVNKKVKKD